jgi:hypothetical protein
MSNKKNSNGNSNKKKIDPKGLYELVLRPIETTKNSGEVNEIIAAKQIWAEADQKCAKFKFHKIINGSFYEEGLDMLKQLAQLQIAGKTLNISVGPLGQ